jgi:hypothetical protein
MGAFSRLQNFLAGCFTLSAASTASPSIGLQTPLPVVPHNKNPFSKKESGASNGE